MRSLKFDEQQIDAIFADLDQGTLPGAAVGIAIGGKPVYRKGFGLASMELPVVLSPRIRMRIGSTTKHFTAFAYMLLCEEGKAGIDDPLRKYFPELHPVTHKVTMRQLMGNISGLRDACDVSIQFSGTARPRATSEDLLDFYRTMDDVSAEPGTAWIYNNAGWLLLHMAIERITGQSFEEVMRERVFQPVGMHDTLVRRWDSDFVPNSATPHMPKAGGGFERQSWGEDYGGAGAIVSTVDDMLRWVIHMDAPVVGSAATWKLMRTSQTLANGTSTGYGLGLITSTYRGVETLHHAGNWTGANAQMLKVPAADLSIVIMVNRSDVWSFDYANRIVDACLPELEPAPQRTSSGPFASGIFRSPTTGRVIRLFPKDGQQMISKEGVDLGALQRDENGAMRLMGYTGTFMKQFLTLVGDPEEPAAIRYNDFGNVDELVRVPAGGKADAASIVGRYRSAATATDATILDTSEGVRLRTAGRFGSVDFGLECLAEGIWRARVLSGGVILPPNSILSFHDNGAGFRYSNILTRALPFRRS
jgi:D-aminopeptidase